LQTWNLTMKNRVIYGRLNGVRGVFVTAGRKMGTNIFAVEKDMQPVLDNFKKELPASIHFEQSFNNAESVHIRLGGFTKICH